MRKNIKAERDHKMRTQLRQCFRKGLSRAFYTKMRDEENNSFRHLWMYTKL